MSRSAYRPRMRRRPRSDLGGWAADAACQRFELTDRTGIDPDTGAEITTKVYVDPTTGLAANWFPTVGAAHSPEALLAKATCEGCAVRVQCLEYALELVPTPPGIWGGKSEHSRKKMRKGIASS